MSKNQIEKIIRAQQNVVCRSHFPMILLTGKAYLKHRLAIGEHIQQELKVAPREITVSSADEKFLKRAMEIVEANISNSAFDTNALAKEMGLSRSQINVKLRTLTGCSTREFIRTLRLKRAAQLLQQGYGNVARVAYEVGFNSLSHFSKVFKAQFGVLPSTYAKSA